MPDRFYTIRRAHFTCYRWPYTEYFLKSTIHWYKTGSCLRTRSNRQERVLRAYWRRRNGGDIVLRTVGPTETAVVAKLLRVLWTRMHTVRVEPVVALPRRLSQGDHRLRDAIADCDIAVAGRHGRLYGPTVGDQRLPHSALHDLRVGADRQRRRDLPQVRRFGRHRG